MSKVIISLFKIFIDPAVDKILSITDGQTTSALRDLLFYLAITPGSVTWRQLANRGQSQV